jgi:hypothetical protein
MISQIALMVTVSHVAVSGPKVALTIYEQPSSTVPGVLLEISRMLPGYPISKRCAQELERLIQLNGKMISTNERRTIAYKCGLVLSGTGDRQTKLAICGAIQMLKADGKPALEGLVKYREQLQAERKLPRKKRVQVGAGVSVEEYVECLIQALQRR